MTLKEMFDRVLIQSGQFNIGEDCIELDRDKFLVVVKQCLGQYNKYVPHTKHFTKSIISSKQFTFTEEGVGIPDYITEIHPLRVSGVMPFFLRREQRVNPHLDIKQEFPFEYRKPVLTVPVQAEYDIHAVYKHTITVTPDTPKEGKTQYSIDSLDDVNDESFFDLLTGKFMMGLARSRRAFTLNDLPILTDASELHSDGKELFDSAVASIIENEMKWHLAWQP